MSILQNSRVSEEKLKEENVIMFVGQEIKRNVSLASKKITLRQRNRSLNLNVQMKVHLKEFWKTRKKTKLVSHVWQHEICAAPKGKTCFEKGKMLLYFCICRTRSGPREARGCRRYNP